VSSDRIFVTDLALLLRTIEVYERHGLVFADAYLVASAERSGIGGVVSFDEGISRVGPVQRVEP
jgi:predicted nucleic acid-binding protein